MRSGRLRRIAFPLAVSALVACGGGGRSDGYLVGFNPGPTPPDLRRGEAVYNTFCMSCHGRHGTGEGLGPPLLDTLYSGTRLTDQAFYDAVERGAPQRHWSFGAMPPVKAVKPADLPEITQYVRWVQQRAEQVSRP
jgi:mono/diheme cytochrome c family protein